MLKNALRRKLPPFFHALKTIWTLQQRLEVRRGLHVVDQLKTLAHSELRDAHSVEQLIKAAGLHTSGADKAFPGEPSEWPSELAPFIGKGIQIWQYPSQFSSYLAFLSRYSIHSYLEIGVSYGGTFVFTVEYLASINNTLNAYCIDVRPPSPLLEIYAKQRSFSIFTCLSSQLHQHVAPDTRFDLVLVDGDHSKQGAMADFFLVKDHAKIIAFHDIVNVLTPGAMDAWSEVKTLYADEFDFFEFIDQYPELVSKRPGRTLLGIGVAVKKDWLKTP